MHRLFFLTLFLIHLTVGAPTLKIIGGNETTISNFPFQVSLQYNFFNISFCGGVIIGPNTVLTLATCMEGCRKETNPKETKVVAGITDLKTESNRIYVTDCIAHENWDDITVRNDIAILKLKEDLVFSENIQPAILPEQDEDVKANEVVKVSGYGFDFKVSSILHYANVSVIDKEECQKIYREEGLELSDDIICAGVPDNSENFETGDWGGPLSLNGKVIGLASSDEGYPGVYTRVSSFRNWIRENSGI